MKTKARMSALPVLQFCGQTQSLGESLGGGRAAALGSAFHARCSNAPNSADLYARLTKEERLEFDERIPPIAFDCHGTCLYYKDADKELSVGLDHRGSYVPYGSDEAVVEGTLDMAWCVAIGSRKRAVVADIKNSMFAVPDGPESLQLIGYAIAYVALCGADEYVTVVYDATEGKWHSGDVVDCWSDAAENNLKRVLAAARNFGGEYSVGSHCTNCYGRKRCGQWLLPLDLAGTSLEPFTKHDALTDEAAVHALILMKRAEDTAEAVKDILKHYARDNDGVFDPKTGKRWGPIRMGGRPSFNKKRFEEENPELVQRYTNVGQGFEQFRWVKDKQ